MSTADGIDQDAALASLGFGPAFSAGGLFAHQLASCLTCGAAVPLLPLVEGQKHPLEMHLAWHQEEERR